MCLGGGKVTGSKEQRFDRFSLACDMVFPYGVRESQACKDKEGTKATLGDMVGSSDGGHQPLCTHALVRKGSGAVEKESASPAVVQSMPCVLLGTLLQSKGSTHL